MRQAVLRAMQPARFVALSGRILPFVAVPAAGLLAAGLLFALALSPADYQQGESVRIMYVHVPAAWMALFVYALVAVLGGIGLVFGHPLAFHAARAASPLGAAFALLCLVTGSLWGKPMWGAWWVWDARLTSMLLLFFLYLGHIALCGAFDRQARGDAAAAVLALVGCVNLPVVKFSVDWWHTLHQPASVTTFGGAGVDPSMLLPLLLMAGGFKALFCVLWLMRTRTAVAASRIAAARLAGGGR
jgi:heme exporter protein C